MNHISAKLIRISCRVFDAFVRIRQAFKETIDGIVFNGDGDDNGAMQDGQGIVIFGNVTADKEIKNKTITIEDNGSLTADTSDCEIKGGALHGIIKNGKLSNLVLDEAVLVDFGAMSNVQLKNIITFPQAIMGMEMNKFNGIIMYDQYDGKSDYVTLSMRKACVKVSDANFQFTNSNGIYLKWISGILDCSGKKGIPFNGEYDGISAKFCFDMNTFVTQDATFQYDGNKISWTKGALQEGVAGNQNTISLKGTYGNASSLTGFTGAIKLGNDIVSIEDGYAEVDGDGVKQFTALKTNKCKRASLHGLTIENDDVVVGESHFRCSDATFEYDKNGNAMMTWKKGSLTAADKSRNSALMSNAIWKNGEFTNGTWKCGFWSAKDEDWKGGYDMQGNWHDENDSPMHWGLDLELTPETGGADENGVVFGKKWQGYKERYIIMQNCGMLKNPLNLQDPSQFGKIEGVFVNRGDDSDEYYGITDYHESIDVIYSNGLRVMYHPIKSTMDGDRLKLELASIQFLDPALLQRIVEGEEKFDGFSFDASGMLNTKDIKKSKNDGYSLTDDMKARAIAVVKSGLYDGKSNKNASWCQKNGTAASSTFKKEYQKCLKMSPEQLDKAYDDARIFEDVWKYHNYESHRKYLKKSHFYSDSTPEAMRHREEFDKQMLSAHGYTVFDQK